MTANDITTTILQTLNYSQYLCDQTMIQQMDKYQSWLVMASGCPGISHFAFIQTIVRPV